MLLVNSRGMLSGQQLISSMEPMHGKGDRGDLILYALFPPLKNMRCARPQTRFDMHSAAEDSTDEHVNGYIKHFQRQVQTIDHNTHDCVTHGPNSTCGVSF